MTGLDESFENWNQIKIIYLRQKNAAILTLQNLINKIFNKERSRKQTLITFILYKSNIGSNNNKGPRRYCKTYYVSGHNEDKKEQEKKIKKKQEDKKDKNRSNINLTAYLLLSDE